MKKYFVNLLVAIDEFFNAVFLGSPHETISARLGRNYPNSWMAKFVNRLMGDSDHCEDAEENEPEVYEKDALMK